MYFERKSCLLDPLSAQRLARDSSFRQNDLVLNNGSSVSSNLNGKRPPFQEENNYEDEGDDDFEFKPRSNDLDNMANMESLEDQCKD